MPRSVKSGFLTRGGAATVNDAIANVGGLLNSGFGAGVPRAGGVNGQYLQLPEDLPYFWAEITASSAASSVAATGIADSDLKKYSWAERLQGPAGGWVAGVRTGTDNAYLAEPAAGSTAAVASGTVVLMRESATAAGVYEFVAAGASAADYFFAQLTSGSSPYSWKERVETSAGVWADGARSGATNAYAAQPSTGTPPAPSTNQMVLMRASSTVAGKYEFLGVFGGVSSNSLTWSAPGYVMGSSVDGITSSTFFVLTGGSTTTPVASPYSITTASGTWTGPVLGVHPGTGGSPGTFLVATHIRARIQGAAEARIECRRQFGPVGGASPVVGSERCVVVSAAGQPNELTFTDVQVIAFGATDFLWYDFRRVSAGGFTTSDILSDGSGWTTHTFLRMA